MTDLVFEVQHIGNPQVAELLELIKYEYIGLFGEPDTNPAGYPGSTTPIILGFDGADARPVGMLILKMDEFEDASVIRKMFIRWEHRGHRYGYQFLAEAERLTLERGKSIIRLDTTERQKAAMKLYRGAGYIPGEKFGYYADDTESVFLQKTLGEK